MASKELDKKLDLSLDQLIAQSQATRGKPAKGQPGVRGRAPVLAKQAQAPKLVGKAAAGRPAAAPKAGVAGKRQVIRAKKQAVAVAAAPKQQRAPRVLTVKATTLKRGAGPARAAAPAAGTSIRRNLAKRIVSKAKGVAVAPKVVGRQRAVAAAPARGRAQPAPRQAKQQVVYVQQAAPRQQPQRRAPVVVQQPQRTTAPVSLARRIRNQRQQQQAAPRRAPVQVVQQQGQRRRAPVLAQQPQRVAAAPRQQQQRAMLGRVQQGGVRKARGGAQQRAPVYVTQPVQQAPKGNRNAGNNRAGLFVQGVSFGTPMMSGGGRGRGRGRKQVQQQRAPVYVPQVQQQQGGYGGGAARGGRRGRGGRGRR